MEMDDDGGEGEGEGEDGVALSLALGESAAPSLRLRNISRPGFPASDAATPSAISSSTLQQLETRAPVSPFLTSPATSTSTAAGGGGAPIAPHFYDTLPFGQPRSLEHDEAFLVHHYAEHLGRWLDGTDPARQFTLRVPVQVKHCSILLHSVLCFAARHRGNHVTADRAYQRCIALLIDRLNLNVAAHDDNLLCAIVILRFFEQLNVPSISGSDNEQHLAGSAAILRASQTRTVDPSSPTLREAAFWVYVRQCLYNATINQQPPNIDSSLELEPDPSSMRDHHPLATLRLETAWANQITWHCASIVNFCFDGTDPSDRSHRGERWQQLWDMVERWGNNRPSSFEPIWSGNHTDGTVFPLVWFAADWHGNCQIAQHLNVRLLCTVIAFGFYHFACILLLSYKPGPKFAIRTVGSKLSDTDVCSILHMVFVLADSNRMKSSSMPMQYAAPARALLRPFPV